VAVPMTLTMSPSATPAPIASQCASNAPTGIGIPALRPSFDAHLEVDQLLIRVGKALDLAIEDLHGFGALDRFVAGFVGFGGGLDGLVARLGRV
jgi:hypothetical protein